jgi:hypothetical protein
VTMHKPRWFSDDYVMVSTAPTCGLSKGGRLLKKVDPLTAKRVQVLDPETGEFVDEINDQLLADMQALSDVNSVPPSAGSLPETLAFVPADQVALRCAVPAYYDRRFHEHFADAMKGPQFEGFSSKTLGELLENEQIIIRGGHGSPSQEQRIGEVPYIKVSDLRAGLMNINPTNRVPRNVAEKFWKGPASGLQPFDLVCPERTSKNIGDFCLLMPGQEQVLMTKEIIVIRPGPKADFDAFYLLWAMTLKIVRDQWRRVVFMQTNREDVGKRYLEIEIPIPPDIAKAEAVSAEFRDYYNSLAAARTKLQGYLALSNAHHFFVSGAEAIESADEEGDSEPADGDVGIAEEGFAN